jgi:acyl-coenzyme A thioesterase PaaI-like protein
MIHSDIRTRALRAFALNRTPGFHFAGNFLGVLFTQITPAVTSLRLTPGPYCEEPDGQVNFGAVALVADMALASVVRANLTPAQRLATVSLHLQFTGAPLQGVLEAHGEFAGFQIGGLGRQGMSRLQMTANGETALFGSGTFMVMNPPPGVTMHPITSADHTLIEPLAESNLNASERRVLARIDAVCTDKNPSHSFLRCLWGQTPHTTKTGATCVTENGPHLGNRVGHVQGGLQVALAAVTAMAAMPQDWYLSGLTATFSTPGEGRVLRTNSTVVHHGGQTGTVRTTIRGKRNRRVLEVLSAHIRRQ